MLSDSFQRLPDGVQQIVLDGLDEEIRAGFQKTEDAKNDESMTDDAVRQTATGIVRSLELRNAFTGEDSAPPEQLLAHARP